MNILVFTGAGISRPSGLKTFRDGDGLWNGYNVREVCSAWAYREHPEQVINFYNERRSEILAATPNQAHESIAALQNQHVNLAVVTQNIDDLHERAGSDHVIHLHGLITQKKIHADSTDYSECREPIQMGDVDESGYQYRPHVVFFDEGLPEQPLNEAWELSLAADVLIVVGSTLEVGPANQIVFKTGAKRIIVVDPAPPRLPGRLTFSTSRNISYVRESAATGVEKAVQMILREHPECVNTDLLLPEREIHEQAQRNTEHSTIES